MGLLAREFLSALALELESNDSQRRPAAQCRNHRVKAVRPQPVVIFFSLGKRSEYRELH